MRGGAAILLLSDRAVTQPGGRAEFLPIPKALATGAVHHALVNAGVRTQAGLAVEAGDCRDLHHVAVLFGYGAGARLPVAGARDSPQPGRRKRRSQHAARV